MSVRLSVHLSVTFVRCGHSMQSIQDIFACLDRWISFLLTENASLGSSDRMMLGFLVEEGRGMEKLVIVAISLDLLTDSLLDGWTGNSNDVFCLHFYIRVFFSNLGRKCIISEERFVLELPTSRAMLTTARPSCLYISRN